MTTRICQCCGRPEEDRAFGELAGEPVCAFCEQAIGPCINALWDIALEESVNTTIEEDEQEAA